jgi:hypothetical protein
MSTLHEYRCKDIIESGSELPMQKYTVLTLLAADSAVSCLEWVESTFSTCFLHCCWVSTAALLRRQDWNGLAWNRDQTSNDQTSKDGTSKDWTSKDRTSNDRTSNDWTSNWTKPQKTEPRMTEPRMTEPRKGPNLEWPNLEMDRTSNDRTSNEIEPRKWSSKFNLIILMSVSKTSYKLLCQEH